MFLCVANILYLCQIYYHMIPVYRKRLAINGIEMDYGHFGDGPRTMVIIPGMSVQSVMPSLESIAAAYRAFTERYTIYVFDRKKDFPDTYPVTGMAEDTASAMKLLGIRDADVFGASQGGMIALALAIGHPELVHRLAVASTHARPCFIGMETMKLWKRLAEEGSKEDLNRNVYQRVYSPAFYSRYARAFKMLESAGTAEDLRRFAIMAQATMDFDVFDQLDKIKCPVWVSGSYKDEVLGAQGSIDISERLGCPIHMYAEAGHAAYDEEKDFSGRLLAFFSEES